MSGDFWRLIRIFLLVLVILIGLALMIHGLLQFLELDGLWSYWRSGRWNHHFLGMEKDTADLLRKSALVIVGGLLVWFPIGAIRKHLRDE